MKGLDLLLGPRYQSAAVAAYKEVNERVAIGVFWQQFLPRGVSNAAGFVSALYEVGCRVFRVHLRWDPTHLYAEVRDDQGSESAIKRLMDDYAECVSHFATLADTRLYVSLCCEHKLTADDVRNLIEHAVARSQGDRLSVPKFVNNPLEPGGHVPPSWMVHVPAGGSVLVKVLREIHGVDSRKPGHDYLVSPDGKQLSAGNAAHFNRTYADARIRFAWGSRFNCHRSTSSSDKGNFDYPPDTKYILQQASLVGISRKRRRAKTAGSDRKPASVLRSTESGLLARSQRQPGVIGSIHLSG